MSAREPKDTRSLSGPPGAGGTDDDDDSPRPARTTVPAFIGKFAVLRELGAGAMGVVYSGYDEDLDRRVAIKVLGDRGKADASRMLREAQALARLSHPNVVQVYEVGRHQGEVFIAMEFVHGQTLRQWLSNRRRSTDAIVQALLQAAHGLEAAHEAGLVHRDFKPDNVLVGSDGRVRVLDFGIARVAGPAEPFEVHDVDLGRSVDRLDTSERLTRTGQFMGTPAYMSPEQFSDGEVDARSDQFSFCVTAFEAVYGRRPFDHSNLAALLNSLGAGEVGEIPDVPSVPSSVREAILRGLRNDPEQRWPSMAALAEAFEPTHSTKPMHRPAIWALGLVAVASAGMAAATSPRGPAPCSGAEDSLSEVYGRGRLSTLNERAADRGAEEAWSAARQTLDSWTEQWVHSFEDACRSNLRGEQSDRLLDRRMQCLHRRKAELDATLGVLEDPAAQTLARAPDAIEGLAAPTLCDDVPRLQRQLSGPADPQTERDVETWRGDLARARTLYQAGQTEAALADAERLENEAGRIGYPPLRVEVLSLSSKIHDQLGRPERGEDLLAQAYYAAVEARDHEMERELAIDMVANLGLQRRQFERARPWIRLSRALLRRDDTPPTSEAALLTVLGGIREQQGRLEEAEDALGRALELRRRHSTLDNLAPVHNALGLVHDAMGRYPQAEADFRRAIEIWIERGGPHHPQVADGFNNLGTLMLHRGDFEAATDAYARAHRIRLRAFGPTSPNVGRSLNNLGMVASERGELQTAQEHFEAASSIFEASYGADHPALAVVLNNLGDIALSRSDPERARDHFARALAIDEEALGPEHRDLSFELLGLGKSLVALDRSSEALPHLERGLRLREAHDFPPAEVARARFLVAMARWDSGARSEAIAAIDTALAEARDDASLHREIQAWRTEHSIR